ncbi:class I SAM-dependent methyltransferase family protein [Candidatus Woesearchaeota archaeon]|nr:class I SAM-dependent methyltransferase family protein [Candidatus Woesearchaeota archaeon]
MASLKAALRGKLTPAESAALRQSYDIIGDIAVMDIPQSLLRKRQLIGKAVLSLHHHLRTVLRRADIHKGKYRTRKLAWVAGERKTETVHVENGVKLKLDLAKVYFSPRSATERKRIFQQVKPGESVLVLFSGIGPFPLEIAKNSRAKEIYGIEINAAAHRYAMENMQLNKLHTTLLQGDVSRITLYRRFDRILMPLPKGAEDFLSDAFRFSRKGTIIHYYTFGQEAEFADIQRRLTVSCAKLGKKIRILNLTKCGHYRPYTYRLCIDFRAY